MDLLHELFLKYPYSPEKLNTLVCGDKYAAVMLSNGNIGVCSTLRHTIPNDIKVLENPNFSLYPHRVIVNAWINAFANYDIMPTGHGDIFNAINFSELKHVVMIGYFGSLSKRITDIGVNLTTFDFNEREKPVAPMHQQEAALWDADAIILTATSLSNNTFNHIISISPETTPIFLLGPSTPLAETLLNIPKINGLFGVRFEPFDHETITIIANGGGTKDYMKRIRKIFLSK